MYKSPGITLIEVVIGVLLASMVIAAVFTFTGFGQEVFRGEVVKTELQQNARFALDKMIRQMRQGNSVSSVLPDDSIEFVDNSAATPGTNHPRYITFFLSGTTLRQQTDVYCKPSDCPADPFDPANSSYWYPQDDPPPLNKKTQTVDLSDNVSNLQFSQSGSIYQISITLTKGDRSVTMQSSVSLRNQ